MQNGEIIKKEEKPFSFRRRAAFITVTHRGIPEDFTVQTYADSFHFYLEKKLKREITHLRMCLE